MSELSNDRSDKEERKRRASRPKVRTGCVTCKRRHKKCDEGQPSCLVCTRSGRTCEYRETLDHRTRAARETRTGGQTTNGYCYTGALTVTPPLLTGLANDMGPEERRYLDFFRTTTAVQCAGYFYDEFWQRLVHQVSEEQPAVCHAVISLGSLNYRFLQLRVGDSRRALDKAFPLQQSNKAIASLRRKLMTDPSGREGTEIALVTCIILVSTMLFQEDAQWAGHHLRSGLKLLEEYRKDNPSQMGTSLAITRAFDGVLLSWLTFSTPETRAEEAGGAQSFPFLVPRAFPEITNDISKASEFVGSLALLVLHGHPQALAGTGDFDAVLRKLCGWRKQIKESTLIDQGHMSRRHRNALTLLELWSGILYILISVETQPLTGGETRYDAFLAGFQQSVDLARELLTTAEYPVPEPIPTFSVNMGIIAPLFWCGFKCRDWLVRQEALILLRRWRRQEGIWSTDTTARVLARVIEIESAGLAPGDAIPEASRIESLRVDMPETGPSLCLRHRRRGQADWEAAWLA
ncbi:hypothetical protein BJY01DRAFT_217922 [Aspergillus pseudoustus]|uniref:Zn(2)-C6 fungal-type domain-containing protein n=1 Tax=Aspergillus pseudoustus TaxID=1810923 RepID=A0ABR4JLW5_9EURO